jgi:hypothetical protein
MNYVLAAFALVLAFTPQTSTQVMSLYPDVPPLIDAGIEDAYAKKTAGTGRRTRHPDRADPATARPVESERQPGSRRAGDGRPGRRNEVQ